VRHIEIWVGLFMVAGLLAFTALALKVSGLTAEFSGPGYVVTASFDNIGDLKVRAPVTVGGVRIGQVTHIQLNENTFKARVSFKIDAKQNKIPEDSSASIFTEGLLGSNYINLVPGFDNTYLKEGSEIQETHSALILENLIGQFLFSVNKGKEGDKK